MGAFATRDIIYTITLSKLVIIPTYNEKENISRIIAAVFNLNAGYHVLIIDDGSPDGTAQIVKDLALQYPNQLFINERKGKLGLGTAYIHGFKWGIEHKYDYLFEMDADFSHNPKDLENLYIACAIGGADVSIGSRYVKGGKVENWPLDRHFYSRGGALFTKLITWMPINDPTAGFMCYSRSNQFRCYTFCGVCFPNRNEVCLLETWFQNNRSAYHLY